MPKERVHHGSMYLFKKQEPVEGQPPSEDDMVGTLWHPGDPQPEGTVLREEPSLDVYWNRDGEWVQVAIDAPTDWWDRFWKDKQENKLITASSVFVEALSRQEINHMIRTLRRARDAAYGSDE